MTPIAGLGGDGDHRVLQNRLPVGFLLRIESIKEIGDLVHFHVGMGAKLLVLFLLTELVPPLVTAALVSRGIQLLGIVELKNLPAIVFVVAHQANTLSGSQERNRTKPHAIHLNG